jgi:dTDP-4-amino-4,6-dideoxygalactose transaminase
MKSSVNDLALFGGAPAFEQMLHVGRPNVGNREAFLARINDMLDRRWLTNNGCFVQEFEQRLSDLFGVKHCIAVCNATIALELAIRALELKGEVIVPSFTFIATAHALQWQEITPVFCDIDPRTHCIDPDRVESLITPRTSGIIGVHVWGRPCDTDALEEIARRRHLKLLFDAAHAFCCSRKGRMVGSFGMAEVFSFHATKFLNTLEGGAIATNDDDLARKIRLMKNFGFSDYDKVIYIGTNGKMNEASAAMGLSNLESLAEFTAVNYRNYKQYQSELRGLPGITLLSYDERERCNYQYIVLELDPTLAGLFRDQLVEVLRAENVLARRYFYPGCHRMEPYASYFPHAGMLLPETETLVHRVLVLPTGTSIESAHISAICNIVKLAVRNAAEVQTRLLERQRRLQPLAQPNGKNTAVPSAVR